MSFTAPVWFKLIFLNNNFDCKWILLSKVPRTPKTIQISIPLLVVISYCSNFILTSIFIRNQSKKVVRDIRFGMFVFYQHVWTKLMRCIQSTFVLIYQANRNPISSYLTFVFALWSYSSGTNEIQKLIIETQKKTHTQIQLILVYSVAFICCFFFFCFIFFNIKNIHYIQ